MGFKIHEVKDVKAINANFDMFETNGSLINIAYFLKKDLIEKIDDVVLNLKWNEEVLMFLRNLSLCEISYENDKFLTSLKSKYDRIPKKLVNRISEKCNEEVGWYWKKMEISSERKDIFEFLDCLSKLLRYIQIKEYLLINKYPPSMKKFAVRGKKYGLKLLNNISQQINKEVKIENIYKKINNMLIEEGYIKNLKMRG
jgi:hypothetical protein